MSMNRSLQRGDRRNIRRRLSSPGWFDIGLQCNRLLGNRAGNTHLVGLFHRMVLALLVSALPWTAVGAAQIAAPTIDVPIPATLLVGVPESLDPAQYEQWFQARDLTVTRAWPELHLAEVRLPLTAQASAVSAAAAMDAARVQLLQDTAVRYATFDRPIFAADVRATQARIVDTAQPADATGPAVAPLPNDPLYPEQWALARMNVRAAWRFTRGNPEEVVAVVDSGVDLTHEDLPPDALWVNVAEHTGVPGEDDDGNGYVDDIHGWDWADRDATPHDEYGHGTHIAGIIAAGADNRLGVSGASPGLRIMPLRVLDDLGEGRVSDLIDALYYAGRHGVRIVNLSLVLQEDVPALQEAVRWSSAQGALVVAAAGNMQAAVLWPAAYDDALAVAATDEADAPAAFTSMDAQVDLAAPGTRILSINRNAVYVTMSGTSMAAAHVSALAGLVWSLRPDLDAAGVRALMRAGAASLMLNTTSSAAVAVPPSLGRIDYGATLVAAAQGVTVDIPDLSNVRAAPGISVTVPVRVTAGDGATPVHGALLAFELTVPNDGMPENAAPNANQPEDHAPIPQPILRGHATSGADGTAVLDLVVPDLQTDCRLTVALGDNQVSTAFAVRRQPVEIHFEQERGIVTADDPHVNLRVALRDLSGRHVEGDMALTLSSDSVAAGMGRQTLEVTAYDGVADVEIPLAHRRGMLVVTAAGDGITATHHIDVQAGRPAAASVVMSTPARTQVLPRSGDSASPGLVESGSAGVAYLQVLVEDAYGNPVEDGIPVSAIAANAQPTRQDVTTTDGAVEFLFSPIDAAKAIVVHINLPDHDLAMDHVIEPARYTLMLPIVRAAALK